MKRARTRRDDGVPVDGDAAALAAGDRMAALYARLAPRAQRLAFLLTGDEHLAQDVAQDAFVKLYGRWQDLRNPDAVDAYLRRTVVNLTHGHWRRKRVERSYLERRERDRTEVALPPDVAGRDELWRALRALSPRQRAVIVLRYYEDLSERQAADVLGCSVAAVKSLTNRALESLRRDVRSDDR